MKRQLVILKVHDADAKEHRFGPIVVEIEDPAFDCSHPADVWLEMDRRAMEYLLPDMSCDSLAGELAYIK